MVSTWAPPTLGGNTAFSAAYNYTGTEVTGETGLLGEGDIVALENYVPDTRWNVSITQRARPGEYPRPPELLRIVDRLLGRKVTRAGRGLPSLRWQADCRS